MSKSSNLDTSICSAAYAEWSLMLHFHKRPFSPSDLSGALMLLKGEGSASPISRCIMMQEMRILLTQGALTGGSLGGQGGTLTAPFECCRL